MNIYRILPLLSFLFVSDPAMAEVRYQHSAVPGSHAEWLNCESDDECVIVPGPTCDYKFAVNKNFSDEAKAADIDIVCSRPIKYPSDAAAKCVNDQCVIAIPVRKKPNADSPAQAPQ